MCVTAAPKGEEKVGRTKNKEINIMAKHFLQFLWTLLHPRDAGISTPSKTHEEHYPMAHQYQIAQSLSDKAKILKSSQREKDTFYAEACK